MQQPSSSPPPAVLHAARLVKRYGETIALDDVQLTVRRGESVAIMGASGSGKTTLLHVLAGIILPDAGDVRFAGRSGTVTVPELSDADRSRLRREEFGFVFQQGFLLPELTAAENVALPLLMNGEKKDAAGDRARAWLAALGLAGMADRRPGQLSGGQAQRVAIARAQATGASVTFADEPTGALDSITSEEVMTALLHSTTGQGRALVVVTHDEAVAARCARVVRMRDGRVHADSAAGTR
ncbi:ABC transporter ATP-binding protein [Microbacterium sp. 179-B 1A2 NHS]|uniref:ABC transporter ATP-binding protein n=1 Tax=Microbacterium sp. 179-B 1A2 NHS TaxID=3142383 RepID=UPI0039A07653